MKLLYEKRTRHPDGLLQAKACRQDGCCVFCEEPLTGIKRVICGSRECRRAYIAAYFRDRRFAQRAA
jgi:hypothetical protein